MPTPLLTQTLNFLPAQGFFVLEEVSCCSLGLLVSPVLPLGKVGSSLKLSKQVPTMLPN